METSEAEFSPFQLFVFEMLDKCFSIRGFPHGYKDIINCCTSPAYFSELTCDSFTIYRIMYRCHLLLLYFRISLDTKLCSRKRHKYPKSIQPSLKVRLINIMKSNNYCNQVYAPTVILCLFSLKDLKGTGIRFSRG